MTKNKERNMKTRKIFLVLVMVAILLLGSVLVVSAAKNKIRVTGGFNNTFFGMGWEWINVNMLLDPDTFEAEGKVKYSVYEDAYGRNLKFGWRGEVVCASAGELDGIPTVAFVVEIVEQKMDPSWVGKFAKVTVTDGGENASEDWLGIAVWDFVANTPVDDQPECEFAAPVVMYPSRNGNLTIHD